MDFAEKFAKKTEALTLLKQYKGLEEPVLNKLGIDHDALIALIGEDEYNKRVEAIKASLENILYTNAANGDTKAAEILLAAKHPIEYDSKVRFEHWKNTARESGAILPDIVVEIIPKAEDDVQDIPKK